MFNLEVYIVIHQDGRGVLWHYQTEGRWGRGVVGSCMTSQGKGSGKFIAQVKVSIATVCDLIRAMLELG